MRRVFLLLILVVPIVVNGQCKFEKDEVDDFEGFHRLETKKRGVITTFGGSQLYIGLTKNDDVYFVDVDLSRKYGSIVIGEDAEMLIKYTSGDVSRLRSTDIFASNYSSLTNNNEVSARYIINRDELLKMKEHPIEQVRFYISDGYLDLEVKSNKRGAFTQELAGCILGR